MDIYFIDRQTGQRKKEVVAGDNFLRWMYGTRSGMSALELIAKRKVFSSLYGYMQDQGLSKNKISKFIKALDIDMMEAEREDINQYTSFNDFFARKLKTEARPIDMNKNSFASPADGRVLAYQNIDMDKVVQVKGNHYSLRELFNDEGLALQYQGGTCIVVRLCPADYHRIHFPDSGVPGESKNIKGHYYSVNPIALNKIARVYCQNKRAITMLQSDNFKEIAMIEVGATCVGSIIQSYTPNKPVEKGEEKGYFKFGGSTVVMFLEKDTIKVDEDIINNSKNGYETKVNMGEKIGGKI